MKRSAKTTICLLALVLMSSGTLAARLTQDTAAGGPAVINTAPPENLILLAQAPDTVYRIGQLEERLRVLNGRIEELSFQLLEMQEQMRRMQEDNEFRFQELEGVAPQDRTDASGTGGEQRRAVVDPGGGDQSGNSLGTITFNENGELVSGEGEVRDTTQTASLGDGTEELYRIAYNHILAGEYAMAEDGFQSFIAQHPGSPRLPDAHFWLGEAQFAQGAYHDAAKTLLAAHKQFPAVQKSPEILLKLGMALAALDNRDTACATYREVLLRYPDADGAVKDRVAVEQGRMSC